LRVIRMVLKLTDSFFKKKRRARDLLQALLNNRKKTQIELQTVE